MESNLVRAVLRFSTVFARWAVAAVFLSNVADRLGLWGPPGSTSVAWGNLENYFNSVRVLNPYLPEVLVPVVGWIVNVLEVGLSVLLIVGYKTRWAGLLSGLLLFTFATANALVFNIKVPLNYSIFTASAAAMLIASHNDFPLSIDRMTARSIRRTSMYSSAVAVILAAGLIGCAPDQPEQSQETPEQTAAGESVCDVEGAWEPISLQFTDPDGSVRVVEIGDPPGLKILSEGHWVFVEEGTGDQGPTSGGGGSYAVDGSTYTESVTYHGAESFIGKEIAFECRTENDRWYQSGELPDGVYLEEVYRRLD